MRHNLTRIIPKAMRYVIRECAGSAVVMIRRGLGMKIVMEEKRKGK